MPYHIIWYPDTREHCRYLTARQRSIVFDSVEEQLANPRRDIPSAFAS